MKDHKSEIGDKVLASIDKVRPVTDFYVKILNTYLTVANAAHTVATQLLEDQGLREQVKTLVANCVSDAASRINEACNLAESTSKNAAVKTASEAVVAAVADLEKAQETLAGIKAKPDLSVVKDEPELQVVVVPPTTPEQPLN